MPHHSALLCSWTKAFCNGTDLTQVCSKGMWGLMWPEIIGWPPLAAVSPSYFSKCTVQVISLSICAVNRAKLRVLFYRMWLASLFPSPLMFCPHCQNLFGLESEHSTRFHALSYGSGDTGNQRQSCRALWSHEGHAGCHLVLEQLQVLWCCFPNI